jgi:hypothetical protein
MAGKMIGIAHVGVEHFYLPLMLVLPLVIAAHAIGHYAGSLFDVGVVRRCKPAWAAKLYPGSWPLAVRPHPQAGVYVLLPSESFVLGFAVTAWALVFYLFAAVDSSPFIYFRF